MPSTLAALSQHLDPISELDGRAVLITTSRGAPVSIGRIKVTHYSLGVVGARVDLQFETESMSCILGVPSEKLQTLIQTWNGEVYIYRLPPGDQLWVSDDAQTREPTSANTEPIVETFPLPRREIAPPVLPPPRK